MPVRKIKIENDYDEEKSIPLASNHSITPIYVPLKQIFLVVMVIGFVYQASAIYQESIVQNKVEVDKWEECLQGYVQGVCTPKGKKDSLKDEKACRDAYECIQRGVRSPTWVDLCYEAAKNTGISFGLPVLVGVIVYRMI